MDITDFIIGGFASVGATFVTNPLEVIKTRIQLQGELAARGTYVKPYRGILNALLTVAKNEGVFALQKGLVPALFFQFGINFCRLGIYRTAENNGYLKDKNGETSFKRGLFWGAFGGVLGCFLSSPFFMIKTQLQAQAASGIAVGYQHKHTNMTEAIRKIYTKHGILALWRGSQSTIPRAALGSGAQMATFSVCKDYLRDENIVVNTTLNSFAAGTIAATIKAFAMTPPDVIATRLFNQGVDQNGRGLYYKGVVDCFIKIVKAEGFSGLYKGFWPNYLRIGPNATLSLLFFDEISALRNRLFYENNENM